MLIKTTDFRPIQITIENEDDYHAMAGLLSYAMHNHPSSHLRQVASSMFDDIAFIIQNAECTHE